MPDENDKQKLGADEHPSEQSIEKEAREIGTASGYGGTTEIMQQMRRGDETKGDPNERDVVGDTTAATDTENPPVPKHQNAENEVSKNKTGKNKED
jgi:hypothetical protein